MNDYPIHVGSMLFTLVDPNPGHEKEYNRWYERDHFYAGCMIGPWMFAGSRWVAPRALKDMRITDGSGEVSQAGQGSFLAVYWVLDGHDEEHWEWAGEQVHWLYTNDRGFAERTHRHTILADVGWAAYRDDDPVPVELALDHGYAGIGVVAMDRADGVSEDELHTFLRDKAMPEMMAGSPVAIGSTWKPRQRDEITSNSPMDLGSGTGTEARTLQIFFCDEQPDGCWDSFQGYVDAINGSGLANVCWAGPFYKTVVGTDTYVDQL